MYCCGKPDCEDVDCPGHPALVAKVKRRDYAREELPPTVWRRQVNRLAKWIGLGLLGWLIWAPLIYLALRA